MDPLQSHLEESNSHAREDETQRTEAENLIGGNEGGTLISPATAAEYRTVMDRERDLSQQAEQSNDLQKAETGDTEVHGALRTAVDPLQSAPQDRDSHARREESERLEAENLTKGNDGDTQENKDRTSDAESDSDYQEASENLNETEENTDGTHKDHQLSQSGVDPVTEHMITLKLIAILRKDIKIHATNDKLYLVTQHEERLQMKFVKTYDVGHVFHCQMPVSRIWANRLTYKYCLTFENKDSFENVDEGLMSHVTGGHYQRKLFRDVLNDEDVFYQFDDICMSFKRLYKYTVISKVRRKFLQTSFLDLMDCTCADFPALEKSLVNLWMSAQLRVTCHNQQIKETKNTLGNPLCTKALEKAVMMLKEKSPILKVLVAAVIVDFFTLGVGKKILDHMSCIVKANGDFSKTVTLLDNSSRCVISKALHRVVSLACKHSSPKGAMWMTALFYAICPSNYNSDVDISQNYVSWVSVQSDLWEVIDLYSVMTCQQTVFTHTLLEMFSPEHGDPRVLSKLNLSPKELLGYLLKWTKSSRFDTLSKVVEVIVSQMKSWLATSCKGNLQDTGVRQDILSCLQFVNAILNTDSKNWTGHMKNVYSSLHLLGTFSGYLDCLHDDKDFLTVSKDGIPIIMRNMKECVKKNMSLSTRLHPEDWTKLFELKLPQIWQMDWEKTLADLFKKKFLKETDAQQVRLFALSSSCDETLNECMLECASEAIKRLFKKNGTVTQEICGVLDTVSKSLKSSQVMSLIVENILGNRDWDTIDYACILYDKQVMQLFKTLECQEKRTPNYKNYLSSTARSLIAKVYTSLEKLPDHIMNKSIPCRQMSVIIDKRKEDNTYFLITESPEHFRKALKEAEEDFKGFKEKQQKVRALAHICNNFLVNTQPLRSFIKINLAEEHSSLKNILDNTPCITIHIFGKIDVLAGSTYFKEIWRITAEAVKDSEFSTVDKIPLDQVYENIFKPALAEFRNSFIQLQDLSMSLKELEKQLGKFIKKDALVKELEVMDSVFSGESKSGWVKETCDHIQRYKELESVAEVAEVVNDLKDSLGLQGDFSDIGSLQLKDETHLRDLTLEVYKSGKMIKKFSKNGNVINFLKELNNCVKNGFISWIKGIIKDTGELSAFVELASISAGENALDIDKVCYFRDAISAAAPLIYGLSKECGFIDFRKAVIDLQSAVTSDKQLTEKLKDSCKNKDWLQIAYETHGSVERSSLRQAKDINESGIYIIRRPEGQTVVSLENCITLRCRDVDDKGGHRDYSLTDLKELQNKLMLITITADNKEDGISTYVEVLEHIINVGTSFLELCDAGHVLFKDWEMTAYCKREHEPKIWVNFGITNVTVSGNRPLLEELKGLSESMKSCITEWRKYVELKRNKYHSLNHFTAKQLVNLCCSMAEVQHQGKISASLLNMLSIIKEDITDEDVKVALTKALQTPVEDNGTQGSAQLKKFLTDHPEDIEYFIGFGFPEEVIRAAIMYCEQEDHGSGRDSENIDEYRDFVMECITSHQHDKDWVQQWCESYARTRDSVLHSQMKFKGGYSSDEMSLFAMTEDEISAMFENLKHSDEKIVMLWKTYHNKLSGLVSDKFVDLDVLGESMQHISSISTIAKVERIFPFWLETGKPNLICCKDAEIASLCLSVYNDKKQPLPSYDEILICTPETTAEEVELILRRALQSGSRHEKIYSLLNADKLNHEVSRKLESMFYKLSKTQDSSATEYYRLIIYCDLKANHSYVATAFENYKRSFSENPKRNEEIKQYLKSQHAMPCGVEKGFAKLHQFQKYSQRTKLVFSERAGMGKSLYVKSLVNASMKELEGEGFTHKTIRLSESHLRPEHIIPQFKSYEDKPTDTVPRIFHFDVPPVVSKGLYSFLLQLFVLRCFQSPDGSMWKCNSSHIYLVEYTTRTNRECDRHSEISAKMEEAILEMFPNVKCLSPEETLKYEEISSDEEHQFMDKAEFSSEAFQRTFQYFKRYEQNQLDKFSFIFKPESPEGSTKEWLKCIMHYCDHSSPSWSELRNFTHFLNMQLKKCEQSIFCSDIVSEDLTGFKKFVVKFMITMSKDFSMRSLEISDESDDNKMNPDDDEDDAVLNEFKLRRHWEQAAHPYIIFNADNISMTFLGFHIHDLHAIDARTGKVVEHNVIHRRLFNQLRAQKVPFNVDFERLQRKDQLDIISRVLGVTNATDPDDTYQLTLDNVMKILAIHLRFESDIPVIIMGETGCGKTRLVQFMCDLLRSGKQGQNMIVVRVHGGTTSETIYRKVQEAVKISKRNETQDMDTVLFFDEANTTEAVNAIKEVICDKSVNGESINAHRLKIIAACNPYRKHSQKAIKQLEKAGLGYRVKSENTGEKLGRIPMRQLVYRVQPLPPSLSPLVWDFGKLNETTQELYIKQMVKTFFIKENLPKEQQDLFTKVISASQMHMAELTDECRMVSLRDIERCMKTVMWFYHQKGKLFLEIDKKCSNRNVNLLVRSLILAVGVCYMASLENREAYLKRVAPAFSLPIEVITEEIESCKKVFIDHVDCPISVAKNDALKENVFMMVVCMNLRIPLFLVGKPGSSKSLSKTIAAHAMQGKSSQSELFRGFKQAQLASFQCSPHSSPDGIISVFRQCAQFQKDKKLKEYVSVVVLDEIGLAEDSPKMPLKTLHPLLEYGCINDEQPEDYKKVAFIGISNWSLDPAKMNRGVLVLRTSPMTEELKNTARAICPPEEDLIFTEIDFLIPSLTDFYLNVLKEQEQFSEFFGLRDFYSLVKLIVSYAMKTNGKPSYVDQTKAVQRNFGGFDSIDILKIFCDVFNQETKKCDTISLLKENLEKGTSGFTSRYLLLPTTNHAALQILKLQGIINEDNAEVIFGSGFPHDEEYSQVCRTVNRVKACMETGRTVILLNIQSLYESLYDALNQCYVKLGGSYYVDLGLGSHRVKCRVKDEFRLIVIEEKSTVYEQFPTPLLNRLEKHCLEISNILPPHAKEMQNELENWLKTLVTTDLYQSEELSDISRKKHDSIVGYTEDTCASVLLQCCPEIVSQELLGEKREEILDLAKEKLIQCATPDSMLRTATNLSAAPYNLLDLYFVRQTHGNIMKTLKAYRDSDPKGLNIEISTFSRLLNKKDLEQINNHLSIGEDDSCLYLLNEFYTEQSFSLTLRDFITKDIGTRKVVLLQSYFECPKQSQRLLFCVRHSITQLRTALKEGIAFDVVLITRLPRISGGCGYIASFGDGWRSLHLDELTPTPGFPGDIYELQSMTVSEILEKSSHSSHEEDCDQLIKGTLKEQVSLVDTVYLFKKSLQKGILQLQDKVDNTERATKRIQILHSLLHNFYDVSEDFIKILERRIISHLSVQETKENWVVSQALSDYFVAEGGSFRHMLWVHLEDTVACALAQILAVIDGDNNLDNLINSQSPEIAVLWLKIFQGDQWDLLKIPATQSHGRVCVVSSTRKTDQSRTCVFPFGWVLKERLQCLWSNVINLKGPSELPSLEYLDKFEELIPLDWVKDIKRNCKLFEKFSEDLVNMTMPAYPKDLNKSFSDTLLKLTPCLYHELTGKDPENVSLPWLFVAYQYMQDNHQHFYKLYLQNNDLVDAGEAIMALRNTIESLRPKEKILEDFAGCQAWLKKVKSLSMTVEVLLSENSLVTRLRENGMQLLKEVRLFWQSTRIMYLLMDHLLESETDMEKKLLTLLVRNLIFLWKKLNDGNDGGDSMEYVIEKVTNTLTLCGNNVCNIFMVKCAYCEQEFTEDDTAKVECGHMFHLSCLRDHNDAKCRKCKKDISTDYKQCGVVDKATFLKVIQFRRKCSSFFVEFMWNFVPTKAQLTDRIVEELINYVRGSPSEEAKKSEKFTLKECLRPDRTTHSLVLKILLRCGMEKSAFQLQRFMDAALSSCKDNTEELYFMIVRSIEDHIHSSNQGCLVQNAQECLDASMFSITEPDIITAENLHTIAKLRFVISVVSEVIHNVLTEDKQVSAAEGNLLHNLQVLISQSDNPYPWIQIYLVRNLFQIYGLSTIHHMGKRFKWALPHDSFTDQDTSAEEMDPFLMYGDLYDHIMLDSMSDDSSQHIAEDERSSEFFPVCMALAAVRQAPLNRTLKSNTIPLIEKFKMEPSQDVRWGELVEICEKVTNGALAELSTSLSQIVFHTAVVVHQSSAPEVELLGTLCFRPGNAKDFFLPTMPSSVYEIMNWITPTESNATVWRCQCGEPVVIGNCGKPVETKKCMNCHQEVGGMGYNMPVMGFEKIQNNEGCGKGHNLSDPDNRRDQEGERNLFGAHLLLVRAIIHSSLIWGTVNHLEEIQNIVQFKSNNVRTYLCRQLQKDIDSLAGALGRSAADAEIAIHIFLKHIMQTKSDADTRIPTTETEEKRLDWETAIHKKLQSFFMDFEDHFSRVHSNILRKGGMDKLAQIVYSPVPELKDLPTTGVFNLPLMWRFEQRMTIQLLGRLIEQKHERKNLRVLTELLKNSVHIQHIRHLPQMLNLQHKLMYHFRNVDLQCYENVPIETFIKEREAFLNDDDEVRIFKENVDILKTIWSHLTAIEYLKIPQTLRDKKKKDLMILDLLPRQDSVIYVVTDYLVRMQNECITCASPTENRIISTSEVRPSHVIDCNPEQDFLTIAMSNIDHLVSEDGTESTIYNFKRLERQIVDRFFTEKPIIDVITIPKFEYNTGTTLRAFFRKEELKKKLEPLNTNDRNCILNDFRFLNEISAALSTLKIAIGFMQLSFPSADEYLVTYLTKDLKLEDRTHTLSLPVLRTSRVKHIQSLWEVLSLRQSSLLLEMNQNPFFMIAPEFHETFSEDQKKEIEHNLANLTKMELFITELHYVIMNSHLKEVPPAWSLKETFDAFVDHDEIDKGVLESVKSLKELKLEMRNSIALWKLAVQMKRGLAG